MVNKKVEELTKRLEEAANEGVFPGGNFALVCNEGTFTGSVGKKALFPEAIDNDIEKDIKRRDITINSIAFDLNKHEIIDYTNGLDDIKKQNDIQLSTAKKILAEMINQQVVAKQ